MDHYIEPDVILSSGQSNPTYTTPRSTKYDLRHNSKPDCNHDNI